LVAAASLATTGVLVSAGAGLAAAATGAVVGAGTGDIVEREDSGVFVLAGTAAGVDGSVLTFAGVAGASAAGAATFAGTAGSTAGAAATGLSSLLSARLAASMRTGRGRDGSGSVTSQEGMRSADLGSNAANGSRGR
jgi:hypothetical protein